MAKAKFHTFVLNDQGEAGRTVRLSIGVEHGFLKVYVKGYGENEAADGHGVPVILELYEGNLRLLAWPHINEEDPEVIDLEGAKESLRGKRPRIGKYLASYFRSLGSTSEWVKGYVEPTTFGTALRSMYNRPEMVAIRAFGDSNTPIRKVKNLCKQLQKLISIWGASYRLDQALNPAKAA